MPWSGPRILAGGDLGVGRGRLLERQLLGERDHALEQRVEPLEPAEVELRQLGGAHLARADQADSSVTVRNASSSSEPGRLSEGSDRSPAWLRFTPAAGLSPGAGLNDRAGGTS